MTDSVSSLPVLPAFAAVAPTPSVQAPAAAPATPATSEPRPRAEPAPLSVDVARGDNGVFVYTLRDPATDTVIAVIPREEVRPARDGRHFDQRV